MFKDTPMNNDIMESSRRDLFLDMIVDRYILKDKQISLFPCFAFMSFKLVWDYRKTGFNFCFAFLGKFSRYLM